MRPALVDRAITIWLAAALTVWGCCLVVLWGWAFDCSGVSKILTLAAMFLVVSLAAVLPGRAVRAARAALRWIGIGDAIVIAMSADGPKRSRPSEAKAMMRLLAVVSVLCVCGFLLTTGAVFGAAALAKQLPKGMLFTSTGWSVLKFIVQFVASLPMAVAAALAFLVTGMVRAGAGRDVFASVFREWLWAVVCGLALFVSCRTLGANVLAMTGVTALAVLAMAGVIAQRQEVTIRPGRFERPIETPGAAFRVRLGYSFSVVTVAMLAQVRLIKDVMAVDGIWWIVLSMAVACWFLKRVDRKSQPPGAAQGIGAAIGALAGVLIQGALVVCTGGKGLVGVVCLVLAVALQIPVLALTAIVVSRQRRLFAYAGGRARDYLSCLSGGVGVGLAGVLLVCAVRPGGVAVSPILLATFVFGLSVIAMVAASAVALGRRPGLQLRYAGIGGVLLCSLAGSFWGPFRRQAQAVERVRPGAWLTTVNLVADGGSEVVNTLPGRATWRSPRIEEVMKRIMSRRRGPWLAGVSRRDNLPKSLPDGLGLAVYVPDITACPSDSWRESFVLNGPHDFFLLGRSQSAHFDGLLMALLPCGHPDAWRCYNARTISRATGSIQPGAVGILRVSADDDSMHLAMAAAKTFENALGPCWIIAEQQGGQIDMLVAGPASHIPRPKAEAAQVVVSASQLWHQWPRVREIRLLARGHASRWSPTVGEFMRRLGSLQTD